MNVTPGYKTSNKRIDDFWGQKLQKGVDQLVKAIEAGAIDEAKMTPFQVRMVIGCKTAMASRVIRVYKDKKNEKLKRIVVPIVHPKGHVVRPNPDAEPKPNTATEDSLLETVINSLDRLELAKGKGVYAKEISGDTGYPHGEVLEALVMAHNIGCVVKKGPSWRLG